MRWRRRTCIWLGAALLAVGCSRAAGDEPATREQPVEQGSSTAGPGPGVGEAPEESLLPDEARREVDWAEAEAFPSFEERPSVEVPSRVRAAYEEAPVPVLLPADTEALEGLEPVVTEHWYSALFEYRGREVTIEGDRVVRRVGEEGPPVTESSSLREGFSVTQTHGVMTVTFTAFGAAYTVDIECTEVGEDGTCTNEQFGIDVADNLVRLGGGR